MHSEKPLCLSKLHGFIHNHSMRTAEEAILVKVSLSVNSMTHPFEKVTYGQCCECEARYSILILKAPRERDAVLTCHQEAKTDVKRTQ